jgi:hypothetical protein
VTSFASTFTLTVSPGPPPQRSMYMPMPMPRSFPAFFASAFLCAKPFQSARAIA